MKTIDVYDEDDARIYELCDKYDLMPFDIIEILLDLAEEVGEDEVFE